MYYPPYHSKYNPIERCWGVLEVYWNGELLDSEAAVLGYAGEHDLCRETSPCRSRQRDVSQWRASEQHGKEDFSTMAGKYHSLAWWSVFIVSAREVLWASRNISSAIRPRMVA